MDFIIFFPQPIIIRSSNVKFMYLDCVEINIKYPLSDILFP